MDLSQVLSNEAKDQIKGLAIAYAAYVEALKNNDQNAKAVWKRILKEDQDSLGIVLLTAI